MKYKNKKIEKAFVPRLAFAGPQIENRFSMSLSELFKRPILTKFNVGPLFKRGKAKEIEYFKNIEYGKDISMEEAQELVDKMRHQDGACHEYLTYEATKLIDNKEVTNYTVHLMLGAKSEDYLFMPMEEFEDLLKEIPEKFDNKRLNIIYNEILKRKVKKTIPEKILELVAKVWKRLTRKEELDALNRPYMAHFYDISRKKGRRGLTLLKGELSFESSLERIKKYWRLATQYYQKGEKGKAYYALGHIVHLIQDLHVPAHVHNDPHGPTILLGKTDSLEQWMMEKNYKHIKRGKDKMNITIWDATGIKPPKPESWDKENIDERLTRFVDRIVKYTRNFRSVDKKGCLPDQRKTGKLTSEEVFKQGEKLIPRAIKDSAKIILNFLEYQKNIRRENGTKEKI